MHPKPMYSDFCSLTLPATSKPISMKEQRTAVHIIYCHFALTIIIIIIISVFDWHTCVFIVVVLPGSNFLGQFCPRGKGVMRLTLHDVPRPEHNTAN